MLRPMSKREGIIIEFHRVGAYVKVSAVEPRSLTEVSIVGAPQAGEAALKRAVIRKLDYVMKRKGSTPLDPTRATPKSGRLV